MSLVSNYVKLNHIAENTLEAFTPLTRGMSINTSHEPRLKTIFETMVRDVAVGLRREVVYPRYFLQAIQYSSFISTVTLFFILPVLDRIGVYNDRSSISVKIGKVFLANLLFLIYVFYELRFSNRVKCEKNAEKLEDLSLYLEKSFVDEFPKSHLLAENNLPIAISFLFGKPPQNLLQSAASIGMAPHIFVASTTLYRLSDKRLQFLRLDSSDLKWHPEIRSVKAILPQIHHIVFTKKECL